MFLAIAVGVLITRIERSCARAAWADDAGCVETPRVTLLLTMLAAAGALLAAKAAACETYEKNRTQTDETVKHIGQSNVMTGQHECQLFGALALRVRVIGSREC